MAGNDYAGDGAPPPLMAPVFSSSIGCAPHLMHALIIGFGDPVLDIGSPVPFEFLERLGLKPGGCISVTFDHIQELNGREEVQQRPLRVPGGSAANVCKCLAGLAGPSCAVRFVGMVGQDEAGREYSRKLRAAGVEALLPESTTGAKTASCLCLVTPDGQRTMRTYLGAALEMNSAEALPAQWLAAGAAGVALAHFEGYSLYRQGALLPALRAARAAGARVSLDLASFEAVSGCWGILIGVLQEGLVDLVLCNEDEAAAVCATAALDVDGAGDSAAADGSEQGCDEGADVIKAAQAFLLRYASIVVVSRGKRGCLAVASDGQRAACAASDVAVVDTVGAGDFFTAGMLHAWTRGAPLQVCTRCACAAGTAAVQAAGAELTAESMQALRLTVAAIMESSRQAELQQHKPT